MKKLLFACALTALMTFAVPDTSDARHCRSYWGGGHGGRWAGNYNRPGRNWTGWGVRQGRYWAGRWW